MLIWFALYVFLFLPPSVSCRFSLLHWSYLLYFSLTKSLWFYIALCFVWLFFPIRKISMHWHSNVFFLLSFLSYLIDCLFVFSFPIYFQFLLLYSISIKHIFQFFNGYDIQNSSWAVWGIKYETWTTQAKCNSIDIKSIHRYLWSFFCHLPLLLPFPSLNNHNKNKLFFFSPTYSPEKKPILLP